VENGITLTRGEVDLITAEQVLHFETFGFLVLSKLLSTDEVNSVQREFDAVWLRASAGQPWSGEKTESCQPFCETSAPLTKLAVDDRIHGTIEQLLGTSVIWGASNATRFVGDSSWHADDYGGLLKTYPAIKAVMYMDTVEKDTGCLRIIPGSHHRSFNRPLRPLDEQSLDPSLTPFGVSGTNTPGYPMETQPGDVLFFDVRAYHGAFGGSPGRSNIQMVYFPEPANIDEVEILRKIYHETQFHLRFPESFLNSDQPRLKSMASKLVELGFETKTA
jgi:ectoine hydroxylase-related dioxygenase (phytanoyl-CoA dioxygenase family)